VDQTGKRGRPKGTYSPEGLAVRRQILGTLKDLTETKGYPPSGTELQKVIGGSFSRVQWHLRILRDQGYVTFEDGKIGRTLRRTRKDPHLEKLT
jgi:DNA-binding transcriptional ArsR family regulator